MSAHTPGNLQASELDPDGGYDCLYAGITIGPFRLDGSDYGQRPCYPLSDEAMARMTADAARLALCWNTHDQLLEALGKAEIGLANAKSYERLPTVEQQSVVNALESVRAAIKAAKGAA
jgi:hypothetical protein